MKKIFRITVNIFLAALLSIGLLAAVSLIPIPGNIKLFTVQSGSMEPKISTGSLIFTKALADYNVGDIITKKTKDPKTTITHRIVSVEEKEGQKVFETKGDANDAADMELVFQKEIVGRVFLSLPYLGYPVAYAKTAPGLIVLIVIPAAIIIYEELRKIKEEIKKKIAYRKLARLRQEKNNEEEKI